MSGGYSAAAGSGRQERRRRRNSTSPLKDRTKTTSSNLSSSSSSKLSSSSSATLLDDDPTVLLFDEYPNPNPNPRSFPHSVKQKCWEKAEKVKGRDPDRWRRDPLGNLMFRKLVGCPGCLCHDYDHILPYSKVFPFFPPSSKLSTHTHFLHSLYWFPFFTLFVWVSL